MDKNENLEKQQFLRLNDILPEFMKIYRRGKSRQPYHINLIDELHPHSRRNLSENAHSRILAKLLQQKSPDGKFEILENFVRYLTEERSAAFGNIKVEKPVITLEKAHIDLCIREKDYAIIIENKANYAPDQEKQLERYIDTVHEKFCIGIERIFVIYLAHDDKFPDDQTLGKYKGIIEGRFSKISFREDVLPWLSDRVLPNVRLKDEHLSSALQQYTDYLKGMFNLRETDKIMNKELQEYIKEQLGIDNGKPEEGLEILSGKKDELMKVLNQFDLLATKIRLSYFPEWKKKLEKDVENYKDKIPHIINIIYEGTDNINNSSSLALEFRLGNVEFSVVLWCYNQRFHYGINCWYGSCDTKRTEDEAFVRDILKEFGLNCSDSAWYGYQYLNDDHYSVDDVYPKYMELVNKTIEVVKEKTDCL
ncbi:MAG: PD-(D/E)XK nuclease family protein [Prevotella sp.]|jgi:hypothetical protein|nr:PD-(D/E)XK nuclease family protein [Prevotella sp.]